MSQPRSLGITLLGKFEVRVGDETAAAAFWRHRRAAAIVKLLAIEPTHELHREHIFDRLWPDLDVTSASNNLRGALHHARKALHATGAPPETFLVRHGDHLVLGPQADLIIDVDRFKRAVTSAWQAARPEPALGALSLYTGELLPDDIYEEWASSPREILRASYLTLLSRAAQLSQDEGNIPQAISLLKQFLAIEPYDEPVHRELIRLYGTMHNAAAARTQFAHLEKLLAQEFGAAPERATLDLLQNITSGAPFAPDTAPAPALTETVATGIPLAVSTMRMPHPVNAIIGRERELSELRHMLRTGRVVTLIGPGGIGKTRLAIELGHLLAGDGNRPVGFIDLSSLRDASLVLSTILAGFGIPESDALTALEKLTELIGSQPLLLVLDNFEQVRPAAAALSSLLSRCPNLSVLVTSRARLQIRGERLYPVDALELPPQETRSPFPTVHDVPRSAAIELFVQRATDVQPRFALTPSNAAVVSTICRKLDGLPLAIEIAAARMRFLTPRELLDRLSQPLNALTSAEQDVPDRHRTMRNTIAWSVELLSPDERLVFAGLSVCAGGWSHDTAAHVLGADTYPASILSAHLSTLLDHSLIVVRPTPGDDTRFSMLETIREFAAALLAEGGNAQRTRQRHLDYFLTLAESARLELRGPLQRIWLDRLQTDHDNLRVAFAFAIESVQTDVALRLSAALWHFWAQRGYLREGQAALERALALSGESGPRARGVALQGFGNIAIDMLDYDLARRSYDQAHAIWMAQEDQDGIAAARLGLGVVDVSLGDFTSARAQFLEALRLWRDLQKGSSIAVALYSLGELANREARYEEAHALLQESLELQKAFGDETGQAYSWAEIGSTHFLTGELTSAERAFTTSLAFFVSLTDIGGQALVLYGLGRVAQAKGQSRDAAHSFGQALRLCVEIDDVQGAAGCLDGLAFVALERHEYQLAGTLVGMANTIHRSVMSQLTAFDRAAREALETTVREHLGPVAEETVAAGEDLSLDEAVIHALELAHRVGGDPVVPLPPSLPTPHTTNSSSHHCPESRRSDSPELMP